MKAAVMGDLHGNWTATQAFETDIIRRGITEIWCLGDVIGKGPSNDRCYDWAKQNCAFILTGNWEEGISRRTYPADQFYYRQLGDHRMEEILDLPLEKHMTISGRKVRLIHGRPVTEGLPLLWGPFDDLEPLFHPDFQVVGFADAHRQGLRTMNGGTLFNCGSVGNGLGVPQVQYAILEGELDDAHRAVDGHALAPLDITLVTCPYDNEEAVREALTQPDLPLIQSYVSEIRTGRYARPKKPIAEKD